MLVASLIAPYLRKFGCYTVPDFIGTRYGGNLARFCAVIILFVASFTYLTAQINGTGTVAARMLNVPFEWGVWVGLSGILLCSMLGGMRAVTWTQVAQYIVLIVAYLIPVFMMSAKQGFGILPHFAQFDAVTQLMAIEKDLGVGVLKPSAGSSGAGKSCSSWSGCIDSQRERSWYITHGKVEILHTGSVYDARYGVSATRSDALLHNIFSEGRASLLAGHWCSFACCI